jgi:hypothetical protein
VEAKQRHISLSASIDSKSADMLAVCRLLWSIDFDWIARARLLGAGIHMCVGQMLARRESEMILAAPLTRVSQAQQQPATIWRHPDRTHARMK